ncbi:hypothetical protein BDR04DRAFT_995413, partial [Suillus decipiens]
VRLTYNFPKCLTSMYIFLCTGHTPLNKHLHCIKKSASTFCPHCPDIEETVHHYLLACLQYQRECHTLITTLGRRALSIQFLLSDPEATPHLIEFINALSRLRAVLGKV